MIPTLAQTYAGQDPSGWLMSEKLDGVRALWDGARLVSRNGNPFPAPAEWLAKLPPVSLDGELWLGRGRFQETLSCVKRGDFSRLRLMAFDAPEHPGTFADRLWSIPCGEICQPLQHLTCQSREHLETYFQILTNGGGEGVMIRHPGAPYEHGRTKNLLKYKPHEDAEGVLVGTDPGAGKYSGQVGALLLSWRDRLVKVGSGLTDEIRLFPPSQGALVTFRFCGLTDSGAPRFPTFQAVRNYE